MTDLKCLLETVKDEMFVFHPKDNCRPKGVH